MDLFGFGSILSGVADVGSSIYNAISGKSNYDYMKGVQKESWNREDNAVQRRAIDLSNAGLSKTLAAGSAASSSAPVNLKAPQANLSSMQKLLNYKTMTQMNAQIDKTKADAEVSKLNAKRALLENAIRTRDFNIIQGKETGQRSDTNDYASQLMNSVNTVLGTFFPKKDGGSGSVVKSVAGDILDKSLNTATHITGIPQEIGNTKEENKGKSYPQVTADAYRDQWLNFKKNKGKSYPQVTADAYKDQWLNFKKSVESKFKDAFTSEKGKMLY